MILQALVEAKINPKFQNLRTSVAAIFFLGTPHQGSEVADYASVLASITHAVTGKIRSDALKILKRKSPILQELTQQFRHDSGNFKILSFYEQRKTHGKIVRHPWRTPIHLDYDMANSSGIRSSIKPQHCPTYNTRNRFR